MIVANDSDESISKNEITPVINGAVSAFRKMATMSVVICVALLAALSSLDITEQQSEEYVEGSLKKALIAYGTARALNSTISVLQSAKTPIFSFGEVLDPVNDLVERFAQVMELAIASLVIQKILVAVTSNGLFKLLVLVFGFLLVATLIYRSGSHRKLMGRIFATLIVLRFSVVGALLLNGVVDDNFISPQLNEKMAKIESGSALIVKDLPLESLQKKSTVEPEIAQANEEASEIDRTREEQAESEVPPVEQPAKSGWFGRLKKGLAEVVDKGNQAAKSVNPKLVLEKLNEIIPDILNVMARFVLASIILPLLFWYIITKLMFAAWRGPTKL